MNPLGGLRETGGLLFSSRKGALTHHPEGAVVFPAEIVRSARRMRLLRQPPDNATAPASAAVIVCAGRSCFRFGNNHAQLSRCGGKAYTYIEQQPREPSGPRGCFYLRCHVSESVAFFCIGSYNGLVVKYGSSLEVLLFYPFSFARGHSVQMENPPQFSRNYEGFSWRSRRDLNPRAVV